MAEPKTKQNEASVEAFIKTIKDERQRKDSVALVEMMRKASGEKPKMWGTSIIGFGNQKVKSPSTGKETDWLRVGFSPRKANLSLYLTGDIKKNYAAALEKLGKHKTGLGCLYTNKLEDVDLKVLKGMIETALKVGFFGK